MGALSYGTVLVAVSGSAPFAGMTGFIRGLRLFLGGWGGFFPYFLFFCCK